MISVELHFIHLLIELASGLYTYIVAKSKRGGQMGANHGTET